METVYISQISVFISVAAVVVHRLHNKKKLIVRKWFNNIFHLLVLKDCVSSLYLFSYCYYNGLCSLQLADPEPPELKYSWLTPPMFHQL